MFKTLLLFVLFCFRISFDILRIAIIKALLPRMPLPNWRREDTSMVQPVRDVGQVDNSQRESTSSDSCCTLGNNLEFTNGDGEAARFKTAEVFTEHVVSVDKVNVTPTKSAVVDFELSIYSASTPAARDARHPFLTPIRPRIKEVGLTVLRNASDRVSEILRENRRRLDAGEDPNTIRKAARRKRAMELSAVRKGRAKLFSLA